MLLFTLGGGNNLNEPDSFLISRSLNKINVPEHGRGFNRQKHCLRGCDILSSFSLTYNKNNVLTSHI